MSEPSATDLLKRIVTAWDCDELMEFTAALRRGRKFLGLTLSDANEDAEEKAVLTANGYTEDGDPAAGGTP